MILFKISFHNLVALAYVKSV